MVRNEGEHFVASQYLSAHKVAEAIEMYRSSARFSELRERIMRNDNITVGEWNVYTFVASADELRNLPPATIESLNRCFNDSIVRLTERPNPNIEIAPARQLSHLMIRSLALNHLNGQASQTESQTRYQLSDLTHQIKIRADKIAKGMFDVAKQSVEGTPAKEQAATLIRAISQQIETRQQYLQALRRHEPADEVERLRVRYIESLETLVVAAQAAHSEETAQTL